MFRTRSSQMFFKMIVLKKFLSSARVLESSLIKLQALRTPTQLFTREIFISEVFKNTLLYRLSPAAASAAFRFPACNFNKKGDSNKDVFSVNFKKLLGTSFDRTPPDDCFLCLSKSFHRFFRTPLSQNTLFHKQIV